MYASLDFETANEKRNSACAVALVKFNRKKIISSKSYLIKTMFN